MLIKKLLLKSELQTRSFCKNMRVECGLDAVSRFNFQGLEDNIWTASCVQSTTIIFDSNMDGADGCGTPGSYIGLKSNK